MNFFHIDLNNSFHVFLKVVPTVHAPKVLVQDSL